MLQLKHSPSSFSLIITFVTLISTVKPHLSPPHQNFTPPNLSSPPPNNLATINRIDKINPDTSLNHSQYFKYAFNSIESAILTEIGSDQSPNPSVLSASSNEDNLTPLSTPGNVTAGPSPTPNDTPSFVINQVEYKSIFAANNSILEFRNIRYAKAPVGDLRFRDPVKPDNPDLEPRVATPNVLCPQASPDWLIQGAREAFRRIGLDALLDFVPGPHTPPPIFEDCLFLDIYVKQSTFAARQTSKAPVLIWVHGGGYISGNKGLFGNGDPYRLMSVPLNNATSSPDDSFILVSINYRLGAFGFMYGEDYAKQGGTVNIGLADQRLAFQWVKDNIFMFGGDNQRITVMGESAGAGSIMYHLVSTGGLVPDNGDTSPPDNINDPIDDGDKNETPNGDSSDDDDAGADPDDDNDDSNDETSEDDSNTEIHIIPSSSPKNSSHTSPPIAKINRPLTITNPNVNKRASNKVVAYDPPFQQAILQSPGFSPVNTNQMVNYAFEEFLKLSGASSLNEARQLSTEVAVAANERQIKKASRGNFVYGPIPDNLLIPKLPSLMLAEGKFHRNVKLLIGLNKNEGELFVPPGVTSVEDLREISKILLHLNTTNFAQEIIEPLYPLPMDGSPERPYKTLIERVRLLISDVVFECNANYLINAYSKYATGATEQPSVPINSLVNMYYFDVWPAFHSQDLFYTFFQNSPIGRLRIQFLQNIADEMQRMLKSFVVNGPTESADVLRVAKYYTADARDALASPIGMGNETTSNPSSPKSTPLLPAVPAAAAADIVRGTGKRIPSTIRYSKNSAMINPRCSTWQSAPFLNY